MVTGKPGGIIIMDEYGDMPEPINLNNLSQEDLEAYKRDPEAFMGWLDTMMGGGPQFHPFQDMDPISMVLSARPAYAPERDNSGPVVTPKWQKSRSGGYGGGWYAQQEARKQKRLHQRAIGKANRKRARTSRKAK